MKHRPQHTTQRGFTKMELVIVLLVLASLTCIAAYQHLTYQKPQKISRVRSDHRSLATAIETYFIDYECYPAMTMDWRESLDADLYAANPPKHFGRTFRARGNTELQTLTTPITYITSNFPDPHADTKGTGFRYYTDGKGWILGSYGPDADEKTGGQLCWDLGDLPIGRLVDGVYTDPTLRTEGIETVYRSAIPQPSAYLLTSGGTRGAFTYDPTNGTISPGDVWRVHQP